MQRHAQMRVVRLHVNDEGERKRLRKDVLSNPGAPLTHSLSLMPRSDDLSLSGDLPVSLALMTRSDDAL
jgi:hypothetical protein